MNSRLCAIGDGFDVSTETTRTARERSWPRTSLQGRDVEHVLQALPRRLQQHRERRVLGGDGEQVGGPLALLPQRRALVGAAARQEQRPTGALPEPRREQRRLRQRRHDDLLDVVGLDADRLDRQLVGGLGQSQDDAVVAPHRLDRHVVVVGEAPLDGHRPRGVDRRAERAEDADPPVADLVAEPLDDDRAVVGDDAGGLGLLVEVLQQVARRQLVEGVLAAQLGDGAIGAVAARSSRTNAPTARPSSSGRPGRSPCQNGILPGSPGAGVTVTRSNVMSSMRHVDAPSRNVSPGRLS